MGGPQVTRGLPVMNPVEPHAPTPHDDIPIPNKTSVTTDANSFGVYRVYTGRLPTLNPDDNFSVNQVADGPSFSQSRLEPAILPGPFETNMNTNDTVEHPFANNSVFNLMLWFYNGSNTNHLMILTTLSMVCCLLLILIPKICLALMLRKLRSNRTQTHPSKTAGYGPQYQYDYLRTKYNNLKVTHHSTNLTFYIGSLSRLSRLRTRNNGQHNTTMLLSRNTGNHHLLPHPNTSFPNFTTWMHTLKNMQSFLQPSLTAFLKLWLQL